MSSSTHTELSHWLCLTLLCLFPSICDSLRYVNAHVIPMRDAYLDAVPLHVQFTPSQIKCVALCSMEVLCMSINYFEDKTCQLLKNYKCDGVNNLVSKPGAKYFDVEFLRTEQELWYYTNHADCIGLNRCSPKCKHCNLTSTFGNIAAGKLVGTNIAMHFNKSIQECQQLCLDNPKCRAIELQSIFCYLSATTRDMMNPDAFVDDSTFYYSERICN